MKQRIQKRPGTPRRTNRERLQRVAEKYYALAIDSVEQSPTKTDRIFARLEKYGRERRRITKNMMRELHKRRAEACKRGRIFAKSLTGSVRKILFALNRTDKENRPAMPGSITVRSVMAGLVGSGPPVGRIAALIAIPPRMIDTVMGFQQGDATAIINDGEPIAIKDFDLRVNRKKETL